MRQSIINSARLLCLLALLVGGCGSLFAQKVEWALRADGFFDNSEGDNTYRTTMTYSGLRLSPEAGLSWGQGRHRLMAGYSGLSEWGTRSFKQGTPIAYYNYSNQGTDFTLGSFHRDRLKGEYPSFMLADSLRYYRPYLQGLAVQHVHARGYYELFLDWTSMRQSTQREQFMAGLSAEQMFFGQSKESEQSATHAVGMGIEGYYYHYALTWQSTEEEHIHDFLVAHPYMVWRLSAPRQQLRAQVKLGMLLSLDRERGTDGWHTPIGFVGQANIDYKRWELQQTLYAGGHQQSFGSAHFGAYYWGDTYYQASTYSRSQLRYKLLSSNGVEAHAGATVHLTKAGLNWHQMITLRILLGSSKGKLTW